MRHLFASTILVLGLTCFSSTAMAEDAAERAAERETARALMDEGDRQFKSGDFTSARLTYKRARALVRAPTTGLAVAEAEERLGLFVEARDSALEVTRMLPNPGEPPVFAESRELARVLAERVLARIGVLQLTVRSAAECGARELTVDGVRWPEAALGAPLHLDPGQHHILARAAGCMMVDSSVDLPAGESVPLLLVLRPLAPADTGVAPPVSGPPPQMFHDVPPARPIPSGALVLMGAGIVGLAVGVTAGVMSLSKTSSLRETCGDTRCAAGENDYVDANRAGWVSNGGFVAGVLTGGAGVLWYLLTRKNEAR